MKGIIYRAVNKINGKSYVGETIKNLSIRQTEHVYAAFKRNKNTKFCRALRKYGLENFNWEILEEIENTDIKLLTEELDSKEIYYIERFDSIKNGYNLTLGNPNKEGGCVGIYNSQWKEILINEDEYIEKAKEGLTRKELANYFNISDNNLKIWRKRKVLENPDKYNKLFMELDKVRREKSSQRNKLVYRMPKEVVENVKTLKLSGYSYDEIIKQTGLIMSQVRKICYGLNIRNHRKDISGKNNYAYVDVDIKKVWDVYKNDIKINLKKAFEECGCSLTKTKQKMFIDFLKENNLEHERNILAEKKKRRKRKL